MKRLVEFSVHEYMDKYPTTAVHMYEGETVKEIQSNAENWAHRMNEVYSGGTTTFVKVWNFDEANKWFIKECNKFDNPPSQDDLDWKQKATDLIAECYPDRRIFIGVTKY